MTASEYLEVGRREDGSMMLRVRILHWLAALFRIQFHVGAWPYGASWNTAINRADRDKCSAFASNANGELLGLQEHWTPIAGA